MSAHKFSLGRVVATPAALAALNDCGGQVYALTLIARHQGGDWGELPIEDHHANDQALVDDTRLLSAFTLPTGVKVWIITEWDRSVTTLLLPYDY